MRTDIEVGHELGNKLLVLARSAIVARFQTQVGENARTSTAETAQHSAALQAPGASFVTLTQVDQLRGCIGSLEAWRPLAIDVRENACAAAFKDPRFPPLAAEELGTMRVEVSVLTPATSLVFNSESDALAQLQPGIDGLILECAGRRATFLPQVWEQLPIRSQFLAHLKAKAGLPTDFWSPELRLSIYRVEKWKEP